MKKLKSFKMLSNDDQKAISGGSSSNAGCCDPAVSCCFPVFGAPVYPSVKKACGLRESGCDFWYSTKGCCF